MWSQPCEVYAARAGAYIESSVAGTEVENVAGTRLHIGGFEDTGRFDTRLSMPLMNQEEL